MPASFLKIGGELVQDAILQLVEVTQELNQHWWCRVECRQTEDKRIPVENLLGQDLQIVTRDQAGAEHVVFDGFVLEASLLYEVFGSYTARLKAVTRSYKLDLTAQEAYYRKKTLTDVAQSLASGDGLTADVRCKDGTKRNYVQWGDPDFRFLVRIADDHQAWIRPTAQGIQICDAFHSGATVMWRQEDGLLTFDVEGTMAPPAFDGTHSDARQMRSVTHTAVSKPAEHFGSSGPMVAAVEKQSKAILPSGAAFLDSRAATADEYKALLERESVRAAGNRVVGHGISQKEDLKAGDTVEIEGVLDGKGTYGLTKVIHRWTAQGYENEFWCTPWKNYVSPQPPELSEVAGVVTARVVDHNDPRKMGRIQVQYDWQENGPTGWVRATTPHAGQDRGFLFMPEIGDEVVVAFEHGDPERPYVVGYLWNGVDQAPRAEFWGEDVDPNDVKRIVTKSGHRIQFVDKPGKESIVIATPQHLKISLIEKADETGRSMILLHSDGDIFINAPEGRVHLHSSTLSQDVGSSAPQSSGQPSPSTPPPATAAVLAAPAPPPAQAKRAAAAPVRKPVVSALPKAAVDKKKLARELIDIKGKADEKDAALVAVELAKLPAESLKKLKDSKTRVVVCRGSITEHRTDLKGVKPRGWPAGSSWDNVPGAYTTDRNEVVVATIGHGTKAGAHVPKTGELHGSANLVLHETTHALDHATGGSSSKEFLAARAKDASHLGAYESQAGVAGQEETYAESAARYYGGDAGAAKNNPALTKYWQSNPAAGGGKKP